MISHPPLSLSLSPIEYRIWVKLASFRWWPAQIKHPTNVPDNVLRLNHSDADFPVYFFGSKDYYWVNRSRSFLYMEGDDQKKIYTKGKNLDNIFQRAMAEVVEAYKKWQENKNAILQSKTLNPAPYFHLKVNKPYGKCQQAFVDLDKSNKQVCECNESDPCSSDVDCLNRLLMYECDGAICKNQDKCKNQRFKKREYAKTEKFKTQAGWGLRSLEDIKKGQFVIEYVGELVDEEECNKRLVEMAARNDKNFYFLTIDKDTIIDAGPKGNLARFMNHSCDPNCETQKWVVNNQVRVGLFAKCDLPKGSELTFNYNLECRGDEKTKCLCNSKNCSGFIGVRPNKIIEEKHKEARKRKSKQPDFAAIHEDECFRCGEVGKLIMCDQRDCPKSYHLECLNLEKIPHGKWVCPVHHCDVCGKKAFKFCNHCPTSFCAEHESNELKTLVNGELICGDHSSAYLNKVKRIASKAVAADTSSADSTSKATASTKDLSMNTKSKATSNVDQNTGNAIKKPRKLNVNLKEEVDELRKRDEERKRKLIESRESRLKRRSSLHNNQADTSVRIENESDKKAVEDKSMNDKSREDTNLDVNLNKTNNDKRTNEEMDVYNEIDFNSNCSDPTKLGASMNNTETNQTNGLNDEQSSNEATKDKIVKQQEDKLNNNSQQGGSSPVKSKSISQKENLVSLEIEPMQAVGKILSDEILFNDESNDSYLSQQTSSQQPQLNGNSQQLNGASPQNGKLRLDQQTNGLSNNDENKYHNLKLSTGSTNLNNNNEISESTS